MGPPTVSRHSLVFWLGIVSFLVAIPVYEGVQAVRRYRSNCELNQMLCDAGLNITGETPLVWYAKSLPDRWLPADAWPLNSVGQALFQRLETVGLILDGDDAPDRFVQLIPALQACPDLKEIQFRCRQPDPEFVEHFRKSLPTVKIVDCVPLR